MTHEEYQQAADYWMIKDAAGKKMEEAQLREKAEAFIAGHNTCALATGYDHFVRCTPVEYFWMDNAVWMFSEGGRKFLSLEHNQNVCLAIYDSYTGFGQISGMQISGKVALPEPFSEEYLQAAAFRKIPEAALRKLNPPMHLLKVVPEEIDFLCSDFKNEGCDSRQSLKF